MDDKIDYSMLPEPASTRFSLKGLRALLLPTLLLFILITVGVVIIRLAPLSETMQEVILFGIVFIAILVMAVYGLRFYELSGNYKTFPSADARQRFAEQNGFMYLEGVPGSLNTNSSLEQFGGSYVLYFYTSGQNGVTPMASGGPLSYITHSLSGAYDNSNFFVLNMKLQFYQRFRYMSITAIKDERLRHVPDFVVTRGDESPYRRDFAVTDIVDSFIKGSGWTLLENSQSPYETFVSEPSSSLNVAPIAAFLADTAELAETLIENHDGTLLLITKTTFTMYESDLKTRFALIDRANQLVSELLA